MLLTPSCGDEETRTLNLDLAKVLRYQLRHVPKNVKLFSAVELL